MSRTIAAYKAVVTRVKNRADQWETVAAGLQDELSRARRQINAYKAWGTRRQNAATRTREGTAQEAT